jgi:diguanylate cyclase (GGDEF)-like protein
MILAHPFLTTQGRAINYLLAAVLTVPPVLHLLRTGARDARRPWWLLLGAMGILSTGTAISAFGGTGVRMTVELCITAGHAMLLAAAVALVLRRGRNDIGGMLDVSVAAIGLGGLLWTALLSPRMLEIGVPQGEQVTLLVSVLVLAGVLGALLRLWLADRRLRSLQLLMLSLSTALVGNIVLARLSGSMTTGSDAAIEIAFMIAYGSVGLAVLDPSVHLMTRPGAAPVDSLSFGRLAFLGLALVADPVAGGMREMFGLDADGPLLAVGSLLIAPLVMVRVGRLARQREQAESRLRHQATHDLLTGLPNRAELLTRLDVALAREAAAARPAVVLLFCDLNGFKAVNDRLGHVAGDELLTEVGRRIRAGLRAGDTLARYGGDEFLLLCEDPAQEAAALRLTEHVRLALAGPFRLTGQEVTIGSSVGAVISAGDLGADELISRADQAMYREKQGISV